MRRFPNPGCFLVLEWDDHLCPSCGYDLEPELEELEKLEKLEKYEEFGDRFRGLTLVVALAFVIVMEFEGINAWVNNWLDSL